MARIHSISTLLLLLLIVDVRTQFFDFFQGFQPIIPPYQTSKPNSRHHTEATTKRPKAESNRHIEQTTRRTPIPFNYEESNRDDNRQVVKEKKRKQTTPAPIFNLNFFSTTVKPVKKTTKTNDSSRDNSGSSNIRDHSRVSKPKSNKNSGTNSRLVSEYDVYNANSPRVDNWYERPAINNIGEDYYTPRPNYEVTNKPYNYNNYDSSNQQNYDDSRPSYHNTYTTKNPFYNRPGVRPAVVENRPPITNRPITSRPTSKATTRRTYSVNPRPTDAGAIAFPEEDASPELIMGPDEDYMSETEKRRYIELAERKCDVYKSMNTKQLQAIPLVPSPEPVQVNVSNCAPTTVPLVVGGRVVTIREFPHMALLGWVKLEGGGYSWKCGGSLISEQYLLTAAHCAYQERDNTVITGPPRVVQLGSSFLDDPGALVVKVSAVIRHPKYKLPRSYYDLALVKLTNPVSFSEMIRPACLGVPPPVDSPVIATGWGQTEFAGEQSLELRSVSLPIWDLQRCAQVLGTSRKLPDGPSRDSQICAGEPRGGKDTCQGDSGGPAQIQDGCVWRVVAVTSLGRSCGAPGTPGLYSTVQRAFVAAQVFGGQRNNQQRRSNTNQRSVQTNTNKNRETDYNSQQSDSHNNNQRSDNDYNNNQQYHNNQRADNSQVNNEYYNNNNNNNQRYDNTQRTNENYRTEYDRNNNQQTNNNQRSDVQRNNGNYRTDYDNNNQNNNRNVRTDDYNGYQQNDYRNNNQNQNRQNGGNRGHYENLGSWLVLA